jgi:hypothetical protein
MEPKSSLLYSQEHTPSLYPEQMVMMMMVMISKSFRKYVSNIPGNHEVKELQTTAILGTAHILRKVLT